MPTVMPTMVDSSSRPDRRLVSSLPGRIGTTVRVCGWVELVSEPGGELDGGRRLYLRDHTGRVLLGDAPGEAEGEGAVSGRLGELVAESAVEAVGAVATGPDGAGSAPVQVLVEELRVLGPALQAVPIDEASSLEERLDWRFLDLRRRSARLAIEVQTTVETTMREVWLAEGFLELHSPKIRPTPNKSGSELFTLDYFGGKAYLAQSPQFYKQMAMAAGLDRIFEIGPVFRANPLVTNRHDTEFTSVDTEISWVESHHDVMDFEQRWLRQVIVAVKKRHGDEIRAAFGTEITVPSLPFPRVTMAEAYEILAGEGWAGEARPGDIDVEGERLLAAHIQRERGHELVFVTDYGQAIRPFYHMRSEPGSGSTRSFDLLWRGLEITTGAQREHRYDVLAGQARERGIPITGGVQTYLDFFKFGCPPHGGFGLGLTRVLMCLLGQTDVREVTYLHRGRHRISP